MQISFRHTFREVAGMAHDDNTKRKPNQKDIDLLLKASEQFFAEGVCNLVCNECESLIKFRSLSDTAWEHWCECGKFNGTMRGL